MFNFKREFGVSDLIAFLAIVFSAVSLWQISESKKGLIIKGSGAVMSAAIKDQNCKFVLTYPVELYNSGGQAVVLEKLRNNDIGREVIFTNGQKIIEEGRVQYSLYLSGSNIGPIPSFWLNDVRRFGEFKPSDKHMGELIKSTHSYDFYIVLVIEDYDISSEKYNGVGVSFDAEFNNGQVVNLGGYVDIPAEKCS